MNGLAAATINITDASLLSNTGSKGLCCVLGVTERGPLSTPVLISSWFEYQRTFGGLLDTSLFPLLCKRALDGGATLYISRVAHYTDITIVSTLTGAKAVSNDSKFEAKNIGVWGNEITVTITAVSGGKRKITIALPDYPRFAQEFEVSGVLTNDDIALINSSAYYLNTLAVAGDTLALGTLTFSGGAETGVITDGDYVGSNQSATGLHAFDNVNDAWYMAIPEQAKNSLDVALVTYCDARKDIRPILRTPVGLTKDGVVKYRTATAPYAGQEIDSWRALIYTGALPILHPVTNQKINIPEIADVIARIATKDNRGNAWDSVSGAQWGKIPNTLGVVVNFGSPALAADGKELVENGINPVISHPTFKTIIWGNRSMHKDTRKVLKYAHVGDIIMHLQRFIQPIADEKLFQPNVPATWRSLYNAIQPELDRLKALSALYAWEYNGDQFVDKIEDCRINALSDIENGKYVAFIRLYVTSKMEYIDINLEVTGASALIDVQAN